MFCCGLVWGFFSEKGSAGEGRDRAQLKAINKLPTTLTTEVFSFSNKLGPSADQRDPQYLNKLNLSAAACERLQWVVD